MSRIFLRYVLREYFIKKRFIIWPVCKNVLKKYLFRYFDHWILPDKERIKQQAIMTFWELKPSWSCLLFTPERGGHPNRYGMVLGSVPELCDISAFHLRYLGQFQTFGTGTGTVLCLAQTTWPTVYSMCEYISAIDFSDMCLHRRMGHILMPKSFGICFCSRLVGIV